MGGYNALMESISAGRRTLVIPRVFPRKEQWVRAQRFEEHGLVQCLHPDQADAANLTRATMNLLESPAPKSPPELGIPWNGVGSFVENVLRILEKRAATGEITKNAERLLRA